MCLYIYSTVHDVNYLCVYMHTFPSVGSIYIFVTHIISYYLALNIMAKKNMRSHTHTHLSAYSKSPAPFNCATHHTVI